MGNVNELLAEGVRLPLGALATFKKEVAGRFGILPNFFRSSQAAPELIQQLWGFAVAGYLDNPMPSVFKERLFVWLSRFCPMRYCIVRHVGFLLGHDHGHAAGDSMAAPESIEEIVQLLRRPSPWNREMELVYASGEHRNDRHMAPLWQRTRGRVICVRRSNVR